MEHRLHAEGFPYILRLAMHLGQAFDLLEMKVWKCEVIRKTGFNLHNSHWLLIFGSTVSTLWFCCGTSTILIVYIKKEKLLKCERNFISILPHKTYPRWMRRRFPRTDTAWSIASTQIMDSFSQYFLVFCYSQIYKLCFREGFLFELSSAICSTLFMHKNSEDFGQKNRWDVRLSSWVTIEFFKIYTLFVRESNV